MSYNELMESLVKEAEHEKNSVLFKAKEEVAKIKNETKLKCDKILEGPMEKAKRALTGQKAKLLHDSKLKVHKETLEIKYDFIQRAFSSAKEKLVDLRKRNDYTAIFEKLMKEALIGTKDNFIVRVNKSDVGLAKKCLEGVNSKFEMKEDLDCSGGAEVISKNGRIVTTNTFETRIENIEPYIIEELSKILFG